MVKIDLKYRYGFNWYHKEGIYVKGYLFDAGNTLYQDEELTSYFSSVSDYHSFREKVSQTNGMFSVIIVKEDLILMGADIIRTFPLFYHYDGHSLHVSDNAQFLAETYSLEVNTTRSIEYLATGFTTGKRTLFTGIYQLQPGQIISLREGTAAESEFYFSYATGNTHEMAYDDLKLRMKDILNRVFDRLIRSAGNRQIIVPLSGGYDSRFIAAMLKNKGIKDVIFITYGKKDAPEKSISKKVAAKLGYQWLFMEHTPEIVNDYFESEEFAGYYPYAANGVGFSYLFEYFGARSLKHKYGLPEDSVFIPGHSGDFLGGSQITKFGIPMSGSLDSAVNRLYRLKFNYIVPKHKDSLLFKKDIQEYLKPLFKEHGNQFSYSCIEDWDYREKLAKTIANSSNVFSYFGFQYRLPYWDREIVEFFRRVPFPYKFKKKLYNEVLEEYFFKPLGLCFKDEMKPSVFTYRLQQIKARLKPVIPYVVKKRSNLKVDWADYHLITAPMVKQLKDSNLDFRIYDVPFNSVIMQWYLAKLRHQIP